MINIQQTKFERKSIVTFQGNYLNTVGSAEIVSSFDDFVYEDIIWDNRYIIQKTDINSEHQNKLSKQRGNFTF